MISKLASYELLQKDKALLKEVYSYLESYGSHSMAYSVLQPKMNYFIMEGIGLVAYGRLGRNGKARYVMSNPLVSKDSARQLLKEFVKKFPNCCFFQVSRDIAEILNDLGYKPTVFGTEALIFINKININTQSSKKDKELEKLKSELASLEKKKDSLFKNMKNKSNRKKFWKVKKRVQKLRNRIEEIEKTSIAAKKSKLDALLEKKEMKFLRREVVTSEKAGLNAREVNKGEIDKNVLLDISEEWIKNTLVRKEMTYLTRPFDAETLFSDHKRIFIIEKGRDIYGFLEIVPLFRNAKVIGYYVDIVRIKKRYSKSSTNYLIIRTLEKIIAEGYEIFSLGLSPFHRVSPIYFKNKRCDNEIATKLFKLIFDYGSFLYKAKGQAFHKERYRADMVQTFFCSRKKIPVKEVMDGFALCNIKAETLLFS